MSDPDPQRTNEERLGSLEGWTKGVDERLDRLEEANRPVLAPVELRDIRRLAERAAAERRHPRRRQCDCERSGPVHVCGTDCQCWPCPDHQLVPMLAPVDSTTAKVAEELSPVRGEGTQTPGLPRLPTLPWMLAGRGHGPKVDRFLRALETEARACLEGGSCIGDGLTVAEMATAAAAASALLPFMYRLIDSEARCGNGAGWMVWARLWCGLLMLRDRSDAIQRGQTDGLGPRPDVPLDDTQTRDLMMAILGIDGAYGGPDISEMAARLYG